VVRDTDGRVFTVATLTEILETEPFPSLGGLLEAYGPGPPMQEEADD
jgi:hypothetical protein